ncbi:DUF1850 domain-containing protein [Nonomuraea deserti]|uniref:DUF1850 domain-containing protein n=1 Tax=Nonomuraea deserti TaxID=1848322 RepID=A0A4R4VHV5_9ACTN|nr:DUF1850 domain-containing protein [Nonomuraea deserti]
MTRLLLALALVAALGSGGGAGRLTVNGLPVVAGSFAIAYVHSVYKAPSAEVFTVEGRRFTMRAVVSANDSVLDYYALDGTRARTPEGLWVLRLAAPATYDGLSLLTTSIGRRTLLAGGRCLPLYPASGAAQVRVAVRLTPDVRGRPCRPPYDGLRAAGQVLTTSRSS